MRWKDVLNCKTKSLRVVCFKECIGIAVYTTALTLEEWRGGMPSRYVRISRSWSKFKQSQKKAFNFSPFWRIMSTQARDFFKMNSWKQPEGCNTQAYGHRLFKKALDCRKLHRYTIDSIINWTAKPKPNKISFGERSALRAFFNITKI